MSALVPVGVLMAVLGVLVLFFSRRQGAKLLAVAAGLLILSSFHLSADVGVLVAVVIGVVALGLMVMRKFRAFSLLAILVAVCVGISWALGVSAPVDHGAAPPADPVDECRDIAFLGLRGSGEPRDGHRGYGEVVGRVRDILATAASAENLSFADMPVDYPALAVDADADWSLLKDLLPVASGGSSQYLAGVDAGARRLASTVELIHTLCGGRTRVVVAGYSQGAMAAHQGLATTDPAALSVVVSVDLIADPLRAEGTVDTTTGTTPGGRGVGLVAVAQSPSIEVEPVRSWCLEGDVVCSWSGAMDVSAFFLGRLSIHTKGYLAGDILERIAQNERDDLLG